MIACAEPRPIMTARIHEGTSAILHSSIPMMVRIAGSGQDVLQLGFALQEDA